MHPLSRLHPHTVLGTDGLRLYLGADDIKEGTASHEPPSRRVVEEAKENDHSRTEHAK